MTRANMRILVIEDDFISRNVIARFLGGFGEVTTAENGRLGIEAVRTASQEGRPFDLVTLDVMMPEMNGHEVLQHLRAHEAESSTEPRPRVLMTTALCDLKTVHSAYQGLCDDYLTKPIRKAALYEKLLGMGFQQPGS